MTSNPQTLGGRLLLWGRRVTPVLVGVGIIAWLIWKVTPRALAAAFATSAWPCLVLVTVVQAFVLFLWDTINLWWLFSQPHRRLPFRTFLRVRTDSVLWAAVNLEVGQGVFAWTLAETLGESVSAALGPCLALALFDFGTLMSLALIGSFLKPDPLIRLVRWVPAVCLLGLLLLVLVWRFLPERWRQRLVRRDLVAWLGWWTWRHSCLLAAQRLLLFLLVFVYAGVCLAICRVPADARTVAGVIPFVLIAESLPGTGGLGGRETALVYLLSPQGDNERAVLLSFGLIWSTVVIACRVLIGLVSRALPRGTAGIDEPRP